MVGCEVIFEDIILSQHIFNSLFTFFNLNFLFMNLRWFWYFFIYNKGVMWQVGLVIIFLWLFRDWVFFLLFETAMLGITHVAIWWCFRVWPDYNSFFFILFVFFDIRCLNRQVPTLFTFAFILFTGSIDLSYDILEHFNIIFSLITLLIFILSDSNFEHSILNFLLIKIKITSTL